MKNFLILDNSFHSFDVAFKRIATGMAAATFNKFSFFRCTYNFIFQRFSEIYFYFLGEQNDKKSND